MARLIYKDPNIRVSRPKSLITALPPELRPFQFKKLRTRRPDDPFVVPDNTAEEILTGYVHGKRASALEERFAKALDFFGIEYIFQFEVDTAYTLPNEAKQIDFIVFDGGLGIPIEIGSAFVHDSASKKEEDKARQDEINPILLLQGINPLGDELYQVPFDRPKSFEDAKDIVASLFISA